MKLGEAVCALKYYKIQQKLTHIISKSHEYIVKKMHSTETFLAENLLTGST